MSKLLKASIIYGLVLAVVIALSVRYVSVAAADDFFVYTSPGEDIDINVGLGWLESIGIGSAIGLAFGPLAGFVGQRLGWKFDRAG